MRSVSFSGPSFKAMLLVVMFLFADLALPHTLQGWSELDDVNAVSRTVSSHAVNADTHIAEGFPNTAFNTTSTGTLSDDALDASRLLLRFPMNFSSSDTVHSASIELECTTDESSSTTITAFVANMPRMWNGSFAS